MEILAVNAAQKYAIQIAEQSVLMITNAGQDLIVLTVPACQTLRLLLLRRIA